MPRESTRRQSRSRKRRGQRPSTQAGPYVREQVRKLRRGQGSAKSRKQAIAIGLSKARQDGVKVGGKGRVGKALRARATTEEKDTTRARKGRSRS